MAFIEQQSISNPNHHRTWPIAAQQTDGNSQSEINYDSELDLTSLASSDLPHTVIEIKDESTSDGDERNSSPTGTRSIRSSESARRPSIRGDCPICCDSYPLIDLQPTACCNEKFCRQCLLTHVTTHIRQGKAKIQCPACSQQINPFTILYNVEIPVALRERYQELLARDLSEKQDTCVKLCPHCNLITILDETDPRVERKSSSRADENWVECEQCHRTWCWPCYAPAHPEITCKNYKKNQNQLEMWAKLHRTDNPHQRNAQRCPKCSIYIEKIDGCDHMLCAKCNSKFCYRCGSRMRLPYYIGHDAKYSVFGCKYKLHPDQPCLRWLIRGSILAGVILLSPIVLAVLIAILAVGIPITLVIGIFALPIYCFVACKK